MITLSHLDALSSEDERTLEQAVARLEAAWRRGDSPRLEDYVPDGHPARQALLRELIATDMEYRFATGETPTVEAYLQQFPALACDREAVWDLICEEIRLRRRFGGPRLDEYRRRFPDRAQDLERRLSSRGETGDATSADDERPGRFAAGGEPSSSDPDFAFVGGRRRLGKFALLELCGVGAFGVVYRARDLELDRIVAIKTPRAGSLLSPRQSERFLREGRSAAQLLHPAIVRVYEVGRWEGIDFLVGEFVPGVTLAQRMADERLTCRAAAELVVQVAEALDYAHQQGVVHRDVKPSNILLDSQGRPHVTDFGLARWETGEQTLTGEGQVVGTLAYMSPEQARGATRDLDGRTDVYSLGVVLYELLTGELPFRGESQAILNQIQRDDPRPPRRENEAIPRDLETICLKAMAKEPDRRYAAASDLAADLRRFLRGEPVHARPVGPVQKLWRWRRRNPAIAALVAATFAALSVGLAGVAWQWRQADVHRRRAETNLVQMQREHARAEENLQQAHRAIDAFLDFHDHPRLADPSFLSVKRDLYESCLDHYRHILEQRPSDPVLVAQVALVERSLADVALQLAPPGGDDERRAFAQYRHALDVWRKLADQYPAEPKHEGEWAVTCNKLGMRYAERAQYDRALPLLVQAQASLLDLLTDDCLPPGRFETLSQGVAVERLRRTLYAGSYELARAHFASGRIDEAREVYRQSGEALEMLSTRCSHDAKCLYWTVECWRRAGDLENAAGYFDRSLAAYDREAVWLAKLHALQPVDLERRLHSVRRRLGSCAKQDLSSPQVQASFQQARGEYETLLREPSVPPEFRKALAPTSHLTATEAFLPMSAPPAGLSLHGEEAPLSLVRSLADAFLQLASCQEDANPPEAVTACRCSVALGEQLVRRHAAQVADRRRLGVCRHLLGDLQRDAHDWSSAAREFSAAIEIRETLLTENPDNPMFRNDAHWSWQLYGEVWETLGQPDAAARAYRHAVQHLEVLASTKPEVAEYRRRLGERRAHLERLLAAASPDAASQQESRPK